VKNPYDYNRILNFLQQQEAARRREEEMQEVLRRRAEAEWIRQRNADDLRKQQEWAMAEFRRAQQAKAAYDETLRQAERRKKEPSEVAKEAAKGFVIDGKCEEVKPQPATKNTPALRNRSANTQPEKP